MRTLRPRAPLGLIVAVAQFYLIGASAAQLPEELVTAPLPIGVVGSSGTKVRGVYAEARFGSVVLNDELQQLESACSARGAKAVVKGRELQWSGMRQLYRSLKYIAEFEAMPTITSDVATCTADITLRRSIKFVEATSDNLVSLGWNFEAPSCHPSRRSLINRCTNEVIAGVAARCINMGDGLVGSTACYSTQNDLSRGLTISGSNYSDDGSGPDNAWGFDRIIPDTLIDPAVFRTR